MPAFFIKLKHW